ncbi:Acetyltransferase (isoleucine patch superfamily) [Maribacter dokdonensis]|uniref:Acetyltransferase (Isoleucine patch superfamily) n=1 Tax=Maribacter dokdonensis TaxID=320912 RepID=A0ABY0UIC8_9FLAO|nr:CatB-related O-acetyltransferase [Maribacter dokdonensis]SDS73022.1 Acetyltransferase (isoleucine patch superfamily) [Maribacter dokdonensis]
MATLKSLVLKWNWTLQFANYLNKEYLKKKVKLKLGKSVFLGFSVVLEGHNFINKNTALTSSYLGFGSYIANDSMIKKTKIGRYCSIGPRVITVFGNHPSQKFVSTHPAFFSKLGQVGFTYTNKQQFNDYCDPISEGSPYTISIGNDVWIGADVRILDGVKIADGAIVAAGALVTKNVEPYSIVGGVPARHIKYRFSKNEIIFLQKFKWWDKDQKWIINNAYLFNNIENFIEQNKLTNDA